MNTSIFSYADTSALAYSVAKSMRAEISEIEVRTFPDGESQVKLLKNPKGKTAIFIISFADEPNKKIMETLLALRTAREYHAKKIILLATYLPYMRQDTRFHELEAISTTTVIPLLAAACDELYAIDPHLHRTKSLEVLAPNAHAISATKIVAAYALQHYGDYHVVGPDEESKQWGELIARPLHQAATILKKQRFSSYKVKVQEKNLGRNVLIIDDIISTGRTVLETIKVAKKHGAKNIVCIGIHGVFAHKADLLLKKHARLITTNTISGVYAKIDIAPLLVETLKRTA